MNGMNHQSYFSWNHKNSRYWHLLPNLCFIGQKHFANLSKKTALSKLWDLEIIQIFTVYKFMIYFGGMFNLCYQICIGEDTRRLLTILNEINSFLCFLIFWHLNVYVNRWFLHHLYAFRLLLLHLFIYRFFLSFILFLQFLF